MNSFTQRLQTLKTSENKGEPAGELHLGPWALLRETAGQVRTQVFVHEQGIAAEMEWDDMDERCVHVVLLAPHHQPVATARLLPSEAGVSVIGRVAVLKPWRGQHAGFAVMRALIRVAAQRGDHAVRLHAQQSAAGFYQRLGFHTEGEPFDEVGIPHVTMVCGDLSQA